MEDFAQLERRAGEINEAIVNATCSLDNGDGDPAEEVIQTPPHPSAQVTPLSLACYSKAWDSALLLLSKGADPNKAARTSNGDTYTPLIVAISQGTTDICRSLLESGAGETPGFFRGYKWVRHVHLPFPPVLTQVTPLLAACMNRAWDLALLLLSKGADPNTAATIENGDKSPIQTPLYLSAVWGSIDVCKNLLASGARPFGSRSLFNHLYDQFDQNLSVQFSSGEPGRN